MRNKKILFISILIFMVVLSIGAISAQNADDAIVSSSDNVVSESQTVSGDVGIFAENPWNTTGELSCDIPSDAKSIKSADLYVNVYAGSAANTYGANANVTVTAGNDTKVYSESLWTVDGSTDGTVYKVNDHTTKCYSDYMIHYDLTDMLDGLSGTAVNVNVDTFKMENKSFDGRIKLIAFIIGYDDDDDDALTFWICDDQLWSKEKVSIAFGTDNVTKFNFATLANVVLSSGDGTYKLNGEFLDDAAKHESGNYYQANVWDVTDAVKPNQKTDLDVIYAGTSAYGSIKNVLSLLMVTNEATEISLAPEYTSVPSAYAGTNNTITVKVKTTHKGNYTVKLLADGVEVDSANVTLVKGENTLLLTDPTIRDIDASTVNGAENHYVNYTAELYGKNHLMNSNEISIPVLYNGNLGYDMEYNKSGFSNTQGFVTGDFVIDVKDAGSYLGAGAMNRTDVWTVNLTEDSKLVASLLIIPYNWFNAKLYNETVDMFDVTFNGVEIEPYAHCRDQGNLGNYGKYGYGFIAYDVRGLLNTTGDNTLVLNKVNPTPAVYPSVLTYGYNTKDGNLKLVDCFIGADLLANTNNVAGRPVKSDINTISYKNEFESAMLYVLAGGAQAGEGNIIFNGNEFTDVWNGTSSTTDLFAADISDMIQTGNNNISFVATGSTILALPQFIVADLGFYFAIDSVETEYTSVPCAYAGTNNTLTVNINSSEAGEFKITLNAIEDGANKTVDTIVVNLTKGTNKVLLTDPTIRPVDETTVNGADNKNVTYNVIVGYKGISTHKNITLPVLYNGNLGSDYEYNITGFEEFGYFEVTGDVVIDIKDVGSYLGAKNMNRTDVWTVDLNNDSELTNAFVYVPYNWFNAKTYTEDVNMFNATFNGATVTPIAWYRDQGNLGNYGKYGYGVFVYDVSDLIAVGDNEFVLNKVNPTPAVYPSALVYMYDTEGSGTSKSVYIMAGADLLSNANNNAGRVAEANTEINVDASSFINATLYVIAASAQAGESDIVFNGEVFSDVWNGTSSTTDLFTADVTDLLEDTNSISFVATGSTILALPQIIVVSEIVADISLAPEYTSVPCAYAGTNNTLTVKVKTNKAGNYSVILSADGVEVDNVDVTLIEGENTVLLTDPTIRPIDETTVNGAENNEVRYEADLYYGFAPITSEGILLPVLYNGNLGSDYEYNITGFEYFGSFDVTGDVVIDIKDVSSYLGASAMNRTDVWTVDLNNDSELAAAFVYVPYNWFNAKTYTEDVNMFNVTFNGATVTPIAWYRDQGNLGNYGKYGYGVFVYDVSDLIEAGDNELVLNKVNPTPAVYPSALVYMYNDDGSSLLRTVTILNGADLLSNANNKAGRVVKSDTEIPAYVKDIIDARLYVLAASAQAGESNIIFNGEVYSDVWNGTGSTTDLFTADVTDLINDTNSISFVATGSTILALPQILVTTNVCNDTVIEVSNLTTTYGSGDSLVATLKDADDNPICGANMTVNIAGETKILTTDDNGQISLSSDGLVPDTYVAEITYDGNRSLKGSNASATVVVNKAQTKIFLRNALYFVLQNKTVKVTLWDENNNPIAGKKVYIKLDEYSWKYYGVTDENGTATIKVGVGFGTHSATVGFDGDENYTAASKRGTVRVIKETPSLMLPGAYTKFKVTDKVKTVKVYLKDRYNQPLLPNTRVWIKVNGMTYIGFTDLNGIATINIILNRAGTYTVGLYYGGNSAYNAVTRSTKIHVV